MVHNMHISMTPFRNESRVIRETTSLLKGGLVDRVTILALHEGDLPEIENLISGATVVRLRLRTRGWPSNLVVQVFKYIELCWKAFQHARREKVHVVNVHALALLPIGASLKVFLGAKLVYDAHELETERHGLSGTRKRLSRICERALIPRVDLTIVVSPAIKSWYLDAYGDIPVVVVLNTPPLIDVARTSLLGDFLGIAPEKTLVIYQGALARGRGVEELIDAFRANGDSEYELVLLGYGELEAECAAAAKECANIHLHPAVRGNPRPGLYENAQAAGSEKPAPPAPRR